MKKTILIIIGCLLIILLFSYFKIRPVYDGYKDNLDNREVRVYYAVQNLEAGNIIYANMISTKDINIKDFNDDYVSYMDADLVVGKCVKENVSIKAKEIIKSSLIEECK